MIKLMLNGGYVSHTCFSRAALVRRHAVQSNTDAHETHRFYWLEIIEIRGRSHWLIAPVIFQTHGTLAGETADCGGCGPICLRSAVGRRPGEPDTLQYLTSIVKNCNKPLTLCQVSAVAGRGDLPHDRFQQWQRTKGFASPWCAAIYRASDISCSLLGLPLL